MRPTLLVLLLGLVVACEGADRAGADGAMTQHDMAATVDTTGLRALAVPAELAAGEALFDAKCAACHGEAALGSAAGPPLVHVIYEPSHHGDAAFLFAAERGVRAHHWGFGDMPPVPGVSRAEIATVVAYVRSLQQQAGIR